MRPQPIQHPKLVQEGRIMACDLVVALGKATVDGRTLFGRTCSAGAESRQVLCLTSAHHFAPEEKISTTRVELPQARQTYRVLGCRPTGSWGYEYGLNEYQVAVGCTCLRAAGESAEPGLPGGDLVRLALERSKTARQAVEVLTGLVDRYGQGGEPDQPPEDNAFLIADPREAYAVETAGKHWVYQEIQEVRVVSGIRVVRQDWDRISQGLASQAIAQGRWPEDGSKLDFAGALGETPRAQPAAWRRWGQFTLLLSEQNGHIDAGFLRRLLAEDCPVADDRSRPDKARFFRPESQALVAQATSLGFLTQLQQPADVPLAWWALGTGCGSLYFPLFPHGDLPAALTGGESAWEERLWRRLQRLRRGLTEDPEGLSRASEALGRLQARLDQETEEFGAELTSLKKRDTIVDLHRQTSLFMEHHLEKLQEVLAELLQDLALVASTY
jgi:secernin